MSFSRLALNFFSLLTTDGNEPRTHAATTIENPNKITDETAHHRSRAITSVPQAPFPDVSRNPFAPITAVETVVIHDPQSFISFADSSAASYVTGIAFGLRTNSRTKSTTVMPNATQTKPMSGIFTVPLHRESLTGDEKLSFLMVGWSDSLSKAVRSTCRLI